MTAESKIRQEARGRLREANWGKAVTIGIALQIPSVIFLLCAQYLIYALDINRLLASPEFFTADLEPFLLLFAGMLVLLLAVWICSAPLRMGAARWHFMASKGENPSVEELFSYYTAARFLRALAVEGALLVRMLGWGLLFYLPSFLASAAAGSMQGASSARSLLSLAAFLFALLATVAMVWKYLGYFSVRVAAVKWETMRVRDCFEISKQAVKGHKSSVFVLMLSFLGWLLLCFFVLPMLFVQPYYQMSATTCSKWLLEAEEPEEEQDYFAQEPVLFSEGKGENTPPPVSGEPAQKGVADSPAEEATQTER